MRGWGESERWCEDGEESSKTVKARIGCSAQQQYCSGDRFDPCLVIRHGSWVWKRTITHESSQVKSIFDELSTSWMWTWLHSKPCLPCDYLASKPNCDLSLIETILVLFWLGSLGPYYASVNQTWLWVKPSRVFKIFALVLNSTQLVSNCEFLDLWAMSGANQGYYL